jgi:hypothetical protein
MKRLKLSSLTQRIDSLREDIQFFSTQKKTIIKTQGLKEDYFVPDIEILKMKVEFLLETINNL